jgi:hypothetical protein
MDSCQTIGQPNGQLYTLTRALILADGKRANIYTDLRYAFATLHIHGAIYKDRGLLTSGGKEIKNSQQILQLLEAVWKPRAIAIIHSLTQWMMIRQDQPRK